MDELGTRFYGTYNSGESERDQPLTPLDEECFRQLYAYEHPSESSLVDKMKGSIRCSSGCLSSIFPIVKWIPRYTKEYIASDVVAGITVAVMHIPQGMAYALLGGVPPVIGIYMAFFPVLVYVIMGTSPHVSMGTFAVVCMMVGKSVDKYSHPPWMNSTMVLSSDEPESLPFTPVEVATAVCLIVGIWQVVLGILRLGCLSVLLSQTLVSGFTTGAAIHVLTSQIKNLLGIKVRRYSGPLKVIYTYIDIFKNIGDSNVLSVILSASFIVVLVFFNEVIKPYVQKKLKKMVPLPVELLVIIIGTLLSSAFQMKELYEVAVVDSVPTGLPKPNIPPLQLLPNLIVDGLVIAIVAVSINISMATIFAQRLGYEINGNQEILASGMGNIFAAFFSCMPFAASLSRSLLQESVGGKTQITSAVSSLSLVFVLLFVGPFFEPLPYCILSTIIVVALKGMFKQILQVPEIFRNSRLDGLVWVTSFFSVVILDIDIGLGLGLVTSVMSLLLHNQNSQVLILGQVPNTQIYVDVNRYRKAQRLSNVLILQVVGYLHFANSTAVRKKIVSLLLKFKRDLPAVLENVEKQSHLSSLILDLSSVPHVDPSAIKILATIYEDSKSIQVNLFICNCLPRVYDLLENSEYFKCFPKSFIFHDLSSAVDYAAKLQIRNLSERNKRLIPKF